MIEPNTIVCGDCLELMRDIPDGSIDAVVTDPPYGLSFMGKDWDHGVPGEHFWRETLRVAKPGAHLLAFGGTRTHHHLMVAIEDAGWEIRDCLGWLYGSGFPKSHDVSKAIDKAAGAEREVVSIQKAPGMARTNVEQGAQNRTIYEFPKTSDIPTTDAARQWNGWGTALKPAWEPIILARKPLEGTVAENVQKYGTGALNIDGSRVGYRKGDNAVEKGAKRAETPRANIKGGNLCSYGGRTEMIPSGMTDAGRWPANILHDGSDEVLALFPETGESTGGTGEASRKHKGNGNSYCWEHPEQWGGMGGYGDSGSAARFFYCAKTSRRDRDEGLEGMPEYEAERRDDGQPYGMNTSQLRPDGSKRNPVAPRRNAHPTVKPTTLMQYLCRLITPLGGIVLDPFCGSGSTGKAAIREGFRFIGIEISPEYCAIAQKRVDAELAQLRLPL